MHDYLQHELYEHLISPDKRNIEKLEVLDAVRCESNLEAIAKTECHSPQCPKSPDSEYKLDEEVFDFVTSFRSTTVDSISSSSASDTMLSTVNALVNMVNEHEKRLDHISGCVEKMLVVVKNIN